MKSCVHFRYILGLNNFSPRNGVNIMYHRIGMKIKRIAGRIPMIEKSMTGTREYRKND
jgi:hypothetical protein